MVDLNVFLVCHCLLHAGREDELERHDVLPQVDSGGNMSCLKQLEDKNEGHECGMRVTEDLREKPLERAVSGAAFGLKDCDAKISEPNINSTTGNSQIPEMVTLTCMASPLGCNTKLESGARCMQSEEKGSTINVAPDVTGILVSKSVSALVAESDPAASGENDIYGFVGNCAVCCKRRRCFDPLSFCYKALHIPIFGDQLFHFKFFEMLSNEVIIMHQVCTFFVCVYCYVCIVQKIKGIAPGLSSFRPKYQCSPVHIDHLPIKLIF